MANPVCNELLTIVPEHEHVIRELIETVNKTKETPSDIKMLSCVIDHIAIRENPMWAYKALDVLENLNDCKNKA